jgi:serine O-acetyltransferase
LKVDVLRYKGDFGKLIFFKLLSTNPGFRAVTLIRIMHKMNRKSRLVSSLIRIRLIHKYGCDVSPSSEIGPGLKIEHPVGIVIGQKVYIGKNFTISQGCTIGEKYIDNRSDGNYPQIGSEVTIGANTTIIGKIKIGNHVTMGANSLILSDVPDNVTVFGIYK